ncbi:MAG: DUF3467 domain-containing protein [Gammaproteobacteria bacterium]
MLCSCSPGFPTILFGRQEAKMHTRIVTIPAYAKTLLETLRESIDQYEQCVADIPRG